MGIEKATLGRSRPLVGRGARGTVTGVVTAGGAVVAHAAAGGEVSALPVLAVLALAVPLSARLLRTGRLDLVRLALASLGAQLLWHAALTVTATPAHGAMEMSGHGMDHGGAGSSGLPMLLLHLVAGLVATGVAVGADVALLGLARELARRLVTTPPPALLLPDPIGAPHTRGPLLPARDRTPVSTYARGPPPVRSTETHPLPA